MKKRKKKLNQETIAQTIYQLSKLFMDPFTRSINLVDLSRRIYIYTHIVAQNQIQPPSTQPCLYKQGYCFAAIAATVERYTPLSARVSIAEALFPSGQVTSHALVIGHQPIRISSTVSVPLFPGESSMHGRSLYRNGMATCNDPNHRFLRRWLDNSDGWDKGRCGKSRIFPSLAFLFFFFPHPTNDF